MLEAYECMKKMCWMKNSQFFFSSTDRILVCGSQMLLWSECCAVLNRSTFVFNFLKSGIRVNWVFLTFWLSSLNELIHQTKNKITLNVCFSSYVFWIFFFFFSENYVANNVSFAPSTMCKMGKKYKVLVLLIQYHWSEWLM